MHYFVFNLYNLFYPSILYEAFLNTFENHILNISCYETLVVVVFVCFKRLSAWNVQVSYSLMMYTANGSVYKLVICQSQLTWCDEIMRTMWWCLTHPFTKTFLVRFIYLWEKFLPFVFVDNNNNLFYQMDNLDVTFFA